MIEFQEHQSLFHLKSGTSHTSSKSSMGAMWFTDTSVKKYKHLAPTTK